jgi:hypothetical protein
MAVIGMKPLGGGSKTSAILSTGKATAQECLHYAMNLPVSTVVTGIPSMEVLDQALLAAHTFHPLKTDNVDTLLARTSEIAQNGKYERYKTG